jgi:hypothetical protein
MAPLRGPEPSILNFDMAYEAGDVKRTTVAAPIEARGNNAPTKGRIDLRIPSWTVIDQTLAAGGVHRLS